MLGCGLLVAGLAVLVPGSDEPDDDGLDGAGCEGAGCEEPDAGLDEPELDPDA